MTEPIQPSQPVANAATNTTTTAAPATGQPATPAQPAAPPPEVYPTIAQLVEAFPDAEPDNLRKNIPYLLKALAGAGFTSSNQLCAFLATMEVETIPRFVPVKEINGSKKRYAPYFGRGYIQLTWRANYEKAEKDLGISGLAANPDLALNPENAARIAVWYWKGATGNNPSKHAERGDWRAVRKAVNGGYNGWDHFNKTLQRALKVLTQPLDPAAIGALPADGSYGLGCADPGVGGSRNITGINPQNQGAALAHALGITARAMSRGIVLTATLDPAADPKVLDLDAQKTFDAKNIGGDGFDGTYTVDEVVFEFDRTLTVRVTGSQPDPNAPAPEVFLHDTNQAVGPTGAPLPPVQDGDIPARIYAAGMAAKGRSSRNGPGGGNVACAWTTNLFCVLPAGLANIGDVKGQDNVTVAVKEMVRALDGGRGRRVSRAEARKGDIWVSPRQKHVGIIVADGGGRVLSNSSSKAKFSWEDDIDKVNGYYGGGQEHGIWRVLS